MKGLIKFGFTIFIINILTACSHQIYPTGNYQQTPVTVDGDLSEWNKPLRFTSEGQVQYTVTNDNENIYVTLETHEEAIALKMLRSGVNIYIDPAAGQSKKICLAFPLPNISLPTTEKNNSSGGTKPVRKEFRQLLLIEATSFSATGFQNLESRQYDVTDKSKIKVAIKSGDNNSLGYEAVIPMRYIFGNSPVEKKSTGNISVGIVINAMKSGGGNHTNRGNASGAGGGMHQGGRGGRGMGTGGGGNYHRNNRTDTNEAEDPSMQTTDRTALFKQDVNWYKFKLAVK